MLLDQNVRKVTCGTLRRASNSAINALKSSAAGLPSWRTLTNKPAAYCTERAMKLVIRQMQIPLLVGRPRRRAICSQINRKTLLSFFFPALRKWPKQAISPTLQLICGSLASLIGARNAACTVILCMCLGMPANNIHGCSRQILK